MNLISHQTRSCVSSPSLKVRVFILKKVNELVKPAKGFQIFLAMLNQVRDLRMVVSSEPMFSTEKHSLGVSCHLRAEYPTVATELKIFFSTRFCWSPR